MFTKIFSYMLNVSTSLSISLNKKIRLSRPQFFTSSASDPLLTASEKTIKRLKIVPQIHVSKTQSSTKMLVT